MNIHRSRWIDRRRLFRIAGLLAVATLVACVATQPSPSLVQHTLPLPGFWKGLWHGCIAPVTFFVSLFSDQIRIYAFPNGGRWYDLGFMLGVGGFSHGVRSGYVSINRNQPPQ